MVVKVGQLGGVVVRHHPPFEPSRRTLTRRDIPRTQTTNAGKKDNRSISLHGADACTATSTVTTICKKITGKKTFTSTCCVRHTQQHDPRQERNKKISLVPPRLVSEVLHNQNAVFWMPYGKAGWPASESTRSSHPKYPVSTFNLP